MKIINFIMYPLLGLILGLGGIFWYNWQFWVILFVVGVIDITSFIKGTQE